MGFTAIKLLFLSSSMPFEASQALRPSTQQGEVLVIEDADAIVHPRAVMIHTP